MLRTWPLKGGISSQMTVLEILRSDGKISRVVLRRPGDWALCDDPHVAADEFRLLQTLQSIGVAAPRPVYLDESGDILPTPYLLLEYVDGQPEVAPANMLDFVTQMAVQLARIHSIDGSIADLSTLVTSTPVLEERPLKLDTSIDEGRIRDAIASAWPLPPGNAPALLHGDFWPGNLFLCIFGVESMRTFTREYQSVARIDLRNLPYWDLL